MTQPKHRNGMMPATGLREPRDVKLVRAVLRRWPLPRGKGKVTAAFRALRGDRDFLMEVEPGLVVPGRLDQFQILWGFMHGYESSSAWRLSRSLIRRGDTVFDVGANIGVWCLSAARRAGAGGSVHAFEPVDATMSQLRQHLALNGLSWVRCERLALADRDGMADFYEADPMDSGKSRLAPREGLRPGARVPVTTLDRYCSANGVERLDFLKVDVEGGEEGVFRGGESVLAGDPAPVIMFESAESLAASAGSSCAAVKRLLADLGYRVYRYDGRILLPAPAEESYRQEDLFALKPAHISAHPLLAELTASS
jgi:FkbM family methyltransferase